MKLQINKSQYSLRLLLFVIFCLVILAEVYLGYSYLYANLFAPPQELPEGNVVRVNLKSYEETIHYLESLYDYRPDPIVLPRSNPFQ